MCEFNWAHNRTRGYKLGYMSVVKGDFLFLELTPLTELLYILNHIVCMKTVLP